MVLNERGYMKNGSIIIATNKCSTLVSINVIFYDFYYGQVLISFEKINSMKFRYS